jgi:hypothetical protein
MFFLFGRWITGKSLLKQYFELFQSEIKEANEFSSQFSSNSLFEYAKPTRFNLSE